MDQSYLEKIKRLGIIAMFSDDTLMEQLVLKGGNVLDVVYKVSTRPSADLDFSIDGDFDDVVAAEARIKQTLEKTFAAEDLIVFDVNFRAVPKNLTLDRADFWGGYKVDFKLIGREEYSALGGDLERIRRRALAIGKAKSGSAPSTKFGIDLSKYEYCVGKQRVTIDGYSVFVYSPPMFVCEKIRAICQQMPSYTDALESHPSGRARDFLDIHTVTERLNVDFPRDVRPIVTEFFRAKQVPLKLIGQISEHREFHRDSFQTVRDTVRPEFELKEYDFYFDHLIERCECLKPLWDE